jgi:hypothetical protein
VELAVGQEFLMGKDGRWKATRFGGEVYSPSTIGGTPSVFATPLGEVSSWLRQYITAEGEVEFCGDSVAAQMLAERDGASRDARGIILVTSPPSPPTQKDTI